MFANIFAIKTFGKSICHMPERNAESTEISSGSGRQQNFKQNYLLNLLQDYQRDYQRHRLRTKCLGSVFKNDLATLGLPPEVPKLLSTNSLPLMSGSTWPTQNNLHKLVEKKPANADRKQGMAERGKRKTKSRRKTFENSRKITHRKIKQNENRI